MNAAGPPANEGADRGIRLQVALAQAGVASRRAGEALIRAGRVRVNGRVVSDLGGRVDPERDVIEVDGAPIRTAEPLAYYALHKPVGVLSAAADARGRPLVTDFLPPGAPRCVPVGRLDADSEGLILLSNDGPLIQGLLHPRSALPRTYLVEVRGRVSQQTLDRIHRGVLLADGEESRAQPQRSRRKGRLPRESDPGSTWLALTLHRGRKREVRRLCEAVGHQVERLIRVRFGPIRLGGLPPGVLRPLNAQEVHLLRRAASLG